MYVSSDKEHDVPGCLLDNISWLACMLESWRTGQLSWEPIYFQHRSTNTADNTVSLAWTGQHVSQGISHQRLQRHTVKTNFSRS